MIFGVTITGSYGGVAEAAEVEHVAEIKQIIDEDGNFAKARTLYVTQRFSVSGRGNTVPFLTGLTSRAPSGISGTAFVDAVKQTTKNIDFFGWQYSGVAYQLA
jgi:hypothetical protein